MSMITEQVERLKNISLVLREVGMLTQSSIIVDAYKTIEELSAKLQTANMERSSQYYNGGWIPTSERLPEDFKDVLVWYEYFRYGDYNRMVQTYGIGCYISNLGAWSGDPGTGTMSKVFAWMPLPEPYKTESEDAE